MPVTPPIPDILKRILGTKKNEIVETRLKKDFFLERIRCTPPPLDFRSAISGEKLSVIAEIKKSSPSAGIIAPGFKPLKNASCYRRSGADAVSVLTDKTYFGGSIGIISLVRRTLAGVPILRKDFIIDDSQIYEARAYGADSFLLIAGILSDAQLSEFISLGQELGMEPLVESHDEDELVRSLDAGAEIVGINNRDLRSFKVDLMISERLVSAIPPCITAVAESGIRNAADAAYLHGLGFNAVLVGETLMKAGSANCERIISEMKGAEL